MRSPRSSPALRRGALVALAGLAALAACADDGAILDPGREGTLTLELPRADPGPVVEAPGYQGDDPVVAAAQARFRTGEDLHVKVIRRSCSPTEGVCHNRKEYPDLRTGASFIGAVGAPCNVQAGTTEGVFDRCERPGDRFDLAHDRVTSGPREIAFVAYVPGAPAGGDAPRDAASPGLHLFFAEPIVTDRAEVWAPGRFVRTFVDADGIVEDVVYSSFQTRWWVLDGGTHALGEVNDWQRDDVTALLSVGIVEGDANRNGVFGARAGTPVALVTPGSPETSYLAARMRGEMQGEEVPGTRMPLANQPLDTVEWLALYCWIAGLPTDGAPPPALASAIDYAGCRYIADPEGLSVLGEGATWSGRVSRVLEFNCGGCHGGASPREGLDLVGGDVWARLSRGSAQIPELPLVAPGDPEGSYLWWKLTGHPGIDGSAMPYDPAGGWRPLRQAELDDVRAWILAGAPND